MVRIFSMLEEGLHSVPKIGLPFFDSLTSVSKLLVYSRQWKLKQRAQEKKENQNWGCSAASTKTEN